MCSSTQTEIHLNNLLRWRETSWAVNMLGQCAVRPMPIDNKTDGGDEILAMADQTSCWNKMKFNKAASMAPVLGL